MPEKKHATNTKRDKQPEKNTYEQDQEEMHQTGTSDPSLSRNPLEKFERGTDDSIQRGQRTVQNEGRTA